MTSKWWCADFETTSLKNLEEDGYVRVWLWSLVGVDENEKLHGFTMETFLQTVKKLKPKVVFFHNLKFDGKFIVDYFSRNGFEYGNHYDVIIDGLGSWYEIKWHTDKRHTTKFWDSLKKFPGTSVKQLGKFVGLPKLDAPYFDKYYPSDYKPTQEEIDYCIRDSEVVARAIKIDLEQGFTSMTLATDCFKWGKETCLNGRFYRDFMPLLPKPIHDFAHKTFRGGVTFLNPEYEDVEVHDVKVFDVNSLYPWVMHDCPLPVGYGVFVPEEPKDDLFMVRFKCQFYVKHNGFPFLQLKNSPRYSSNEFVRFSEGEEELYMTSVDYKNFKKNYKIIDEHDHTYLKFNSQVGLMAPHVDYWMQKKKEYEAQGLPFMRYIAKTMMNGFYGKTALRTARQNVVPYLDSKTGCMCYSNKVETEVEPIYVPYGAFTTAWARDKLINSALKVWKDFIYCDTDSIHCFDSDNIPLDIHQTELGKWKDETLDGAYEYARYIKQKTYCHARPGIDSTGKKYKEVVEIRAAGLNVASRTGIAFDEFKYGLTVKNANFKMATVPGGAILKPCDWVMNKDPFDVIIEYMNNMKEETEDERRSRHKRNAEGVL